jgi:hypothetical protein
MKVTKWSTFTGGLTVSEQQPEQISGEAGSLSAAPAAPDSSDACEQIAASVQELAQDPVLVSSEIESPALAPEQQADPLGDASKADAVANSFKSVPPKSETAEADAPSLPGNVIVMSSGDRAWAGHAASSEAEVDESQGMFGKRRIAALSAVVALALAAGALGGALATASLTHGGGDNVATSGNHALEAAVARIDGDILALKASLEHTSKIGMSQFNKTSDRLDKLERAQAEPTAKIARLSEAVDKLRAAPVAAPVPVAAAPVAAKDVTGSVSPPAATTAAPKAEVGRLPTVEGWVLREVDGGGALIEGRQGIYEVYAGDPVPGLGRIDAIRRQDGRWVVVTSKGLIVAR